MQHRERERERGKKERKKNQNTTTKKEQRKSNLFDEHVLRHTFYIFFFSPSLKGERKERRGRFDLHNNAQKHTEDTLREKESVRRQNHHTFLHRNESLFEEEDKGKRRFVESAILKHS